MAVQMHLDADAAKTPSGPPPIPKKISTLYLGSETYKAPKNITISN